jgi:hypothetical protein
MTKRIIARACLLLAGGGAAIAAGIVPAQAATGGPHPAPLCGALNMVESSPSYYQYAVSEGMDIAMTIDAAHGSGANGNTGMFLAVAQSSQASSPSCS